LPALSFDLSSHHLLPLFFPLLLSFHRAIPHPIYRFDGAEVCLIVKDAPGGDGGKQPKGGNKGAKAKARAQKLAEAAGVSKVIAVSKLKSKYEPHEAKRALANAFDLFLADARVVPSLARLLGKAFFRAKKQPVPVDLRGRDWETPVSEAVRATYFYRGGGSCVNIRVARSSFSAEQVAENVESALRALVPKLAPGNGGRWGGVRSVLLKSASSAALPVYQSDPRGLDDDNDDDEDGHESEEEEKVTEKKEKKGKEEKVGVAEKKKKSAAVGAGDEKKKKKKLKA